LVIIIQPHTLAPEGIDHKNAPMDPDETLRMESIPNLLLSSLGIHSAQKNKRLFVKPETNINTQSASHKNLQVCEEATSSAQNPSQEPPKACSP